MEPDEKFNADIELVSRIKAIPTILDVVCLTTGLGFAAVARVTEDSWIACGVRDTIEFGLQPGGELKLDTTICNDIRQTRKLVVIDNVVDDPEFCNHPTPAMYGFQSYISVPITLPDGTFFGTLCGIDAKPIRLNTPATIGMFTLYAEMIGFQLQAHLNLTASAAILLDERRTSELREQFIAVLGHDLRNPLAAIGGGVELIAKTPLNDRAAKIVPMVQSSIARMAGLIDNVMDFARGRLGTGLTLTRAKWDVASLIGQVVSELQSSQPDRLIQTELGLDGPVDCDGSRLSQLVSNLVANALTHGAAESPVHVTAIAKNGILVICVSNAGEQIPPAALERLFEPFERGAMKPSQQGLGLGLYIATQIAKAHGGALSADSTPEETRFVFRMPLT
ncbi:GAF domain-containing sensor histidine kinase [Lichenifustis flavocetrariae]|uniref:histidine kinase n=1 Tax=Lichenifustis flavocetrariae TaxID=2949735 RepID=A0AA41YZR2_9HYPH|nr:GAF domain-containing sensor histidine kinase [Lichenifustis flavocetrariae]MCW6511549.1 GAF domain-containing sensor histidine kinase [Lichenifustis flavocetrariae]